MVCIRACASLLLFFLFLYHAKKLPNLLDSDINTFCFKLWSQRAYALPQRESPWGKHISPCYASFYFFAPQNFCEKMSHLSVLRIFLCFCAKKSFWKQHHISGAAAKRAHLRGANLTVLRIFLLFCAPKLFWQKTNLGVEEKKRKSCRTCLIQISLRFASKTSTLTTFSIVFGYRL